MDSRGNHDSFRISTDPADFDLDAIYAYLSASYWATGIPKETVSRSIANALCFGVFHDDAQIGFARVITDRATFAYLGDVYILDSYQGRGLGTWLMQTITAHPDLQGLRRWSLVTRDAHGLYARFGFRALPDPSRYMERSDIISYLDMD
ncbi:MAG: GNAT family N-acetyltransferase [Thermomicrobiales bacterium]